MTNVRPLQPRDIEALYAISLPTGLAGGDASSLYRDPKLLGHVYSAPYASLQPDLCFVAEDAAGVAGFVVGTDDTRAWESRLKREWWPMLRRQYPAPDAAQVAEWPHDQRRIFMIHNPAPVPTAVVQAYPAHLHINLLPRLQGARNRRAPVCRLARRGGRPRGRPPACRREPAKYACLRLLASPGLCRAGYPRGPRRAHGLAGLGLTPQREFGQRPALTAVMRQLRNRSFSPPFDRRRTGPSIAPRTATSRQTPLGLARAPVPSAAGNQAGCG